MSDFSYISIRKQRFLDMLSACDDSVSREKILLDKVIELENSLTELQDCYTSLLVRYSRLFSSPF